MFPQNDYGDRFGGVGRCLELAYCTLACRASGMPRAVYSILDNGGSWADLSPAQQRRLQRDQFYYQPKRRNESFVRVNRADRLATV